MAFRILNYISYFIMAFSFYIMACVVDLLIAPTFTKLKFIEAYENGRVIYSKIVNGEENTSYDIPIELKPGMIILGVFEVKRFYSAENDIERIIKSPTREYSIFNTKRTHIPNTTSQVSAEYQISLTVSDGCGYTAYSRNSVVKIYNIITYMRPHVYNNTSINFCVKR